MLQNQGAVSTQSKHTVKEKCDKLLSDLPMIPGRKALPTSKPYTIQDSASSLIFNYVSELTAAVLEDSLNLAKHRKSNEISSDDVNLALSE